MDSRCYNPRLAAPGVALSYEWSIAFRHLRARRKRSLSVVTWLGLIGVAIGVAALVGGFAVTAGFEIAFRDKVLGMTAHVLVREFGVRFSSYRDVDARIKQVPGVEATSPMTFNEAMVSGPTGMAGAIVKGIAPDRVSAVLRVTDYLLEGKLEALGPRDADGLDGVILGAELARRLGVKQGGLVTLVSPLKSADPEEWQAQGRTPTSRTFRVRGIFEAGFYEYDSRLVLMELSSAQRFFGLGDVITGLEVRVKNEMEASNLADQLREMLGAESFSVTDWRTQNRNLFLSLMYQRLAILVVLSVMIVLASCNVACMLVMLVLERTREIAILKAMGARDFSVLKVFVAEGMAIGVVGTVLGLVLAFALFEGVLSHGVSLDPKVYGIARLPVVFNPLDYLYSAGGALVITFVATIFPALRGARLHPVEGLRETHG